MPCNTAEYCNKISFCETYNGKARHFIQKCQFKYVKPVKGGTYFIEIHTIFQHRISTM